MTHKEAIVKILKDQNITKSELARRCGYHGHVSSLEPRLNGDIRLSTLIRMANVLGYEVVIQPIPQDNEWRAGVQMVLDS